MGRFLEPTTRKTNSLPYLLVPYCLTKRLFASRFLTHTTRSGNILVDKLEKRKGPNQLTQTLKTAVFLTPSIKTRRYVLNLGKFLHPGCHHLAYSLQTTHHFLHTPFAVIFLNHFFWHLLNVVKQNDSNPVFANPAPVEIRFFREPLITSWLRRSADVIELN